MSMKVKRPTKSGYQAIRVNALKAKAKELGLELVQKG
jgi:hypothetical protein